MITESPVEESIKKLDLQISKAAEFTTKKLALIFVIAADMREGLLEAKRDGGALPEHDWWANDAVVRLTKQLIRINAHVQKKVNNIDFDEAELEKQFHKSLEHGDPLIKEAFEALGK